MFVFGVCIVVFCMKGEGISIGVVCWEMFCDVGGFE